jgi:uncharacterized membrane protein
MIGYPWGALATGIMLCLAAVLTLTRHYLLDESSTNYPKAPAFVRHVMFAFAAVIMFLGLQFIWVFFNDPRQSVPPQPGPAIQLLSTALVLYKATLLGNILAQRYPSQVWDRLNRINAALRCKDRKPIFGSWFAR